VCSGAVQAGSVHHCYKLLFFVIQEVKVEVVSTSGIEDEVRSVVQFHIHIVLVIIIVHLHITTLVLVYHVSIRFINRVIDTVIIFILWIVTQTIFFFVIIIVIIIIITIIVIVIPVLFITETVTFVLIPVARVTLLISERFPQSLKSLNKGARSVIRTASNSRFLRRFSSLLLVLILIPN